MSTTTERVEGDMWLQVPATWGAYLKLDRARGDSARPKYVYCDGRLTIVSPGYSHETVASRIAALVEAMLVELDIDFVATRSMTLKQGKPKTKAVEGDASYYLTNLTKIRGNQKLVMGADPPPDLEIEVVATHPVEDSLEVHAAFGVREVWVLRDSGLTFLTLTEGGIYVDSPVSGCLPYVSSDELEPWIFGDDFPTEPARRRAFLEWVRTTLVPRRTESGEVNDG